MKFIVLLFSLFILNAAEPLCQLPSQNVIHSALCERIGMQHFVEKTKIDKSLSNRQLVQQGIELAIELAYYDYFEKFKGDPHLLIV